jgi:hypothetical protein
MRLSRTLIPILLAVSAFAGCGSGSEATSPSTTQATASKPFVTAADRVCREMQRETKQLGHGFLARVASSPQHNLLRAETEILVRPGIRILDRAAARLRAVDERSEDPSLSVYVDLYEPLLQLAKLRLAAGEAEDLASAKNLEGQMEQIGAEQRVAARIAGLRDCRVDFLHALVSSWKG